MNYLTEGRIDFESAQRARLRDSYRWHKASWECFPGRNDDARDFLTRIDRMREGFRLLIVSPHSPARPTWWPEGDEHWKTIPIPEKFFSLRFYAFQLCANPTKKVAKMGPGDTRAKNGKRVPLRTREELLGWLRRKGDQGGFLVDEGSLATIPRPREYFERQGIPGMHSAVEFHGVLEVNEPERFNLTFTHGIGSAKAFGFGLLVLKPIASPAY